MTGNRLERVENCPVELYQMMLKCWDADPELRPSFKELLDFLVMEEEQVTKMELLLDSENYDANIENLDFHESV